MDPYISPNSNLCVNDLRTNECRRSECCGLYAVCTRGFKMTASISERLGTCFIFSYLRMFSASHRQLHDINRRIPLPRRPFDRSLCRTGLAIRSQEGKAFKVQPRFAEWLSTANAPPRKICPGGNPTWVFPLSALQLILGRYGYPFPGSVGHYYSKFEGEKEIPDGCPGIWPPGSHVKERP